MESPRVKGMVQCKSCGWAGPEWRLRDGPDYTLVCPNCGSPEVEPITDDEWKRQVQK